jgi:hypothetical protein
VADDTRPQVEIELVLDDGTVKKAFARVGKEGEETSKGLTSAFSNIFSGVNGRGFPAFTELNSALSLAGKGFALLKGAAEGAIDTILKAEGIQKVNSQFDQLAARAGVSGQAIRSGLSEVSGGVVDINDAVSAANQALIRLGSSGAQIPAIFEQARKAANAFGGDAIGRFQDFVGAIQSGNSRTLRQVGIQLDLNKAVDEYAKSLGISKNLLTEQQIIQARTNAVLEAARQSYEGITADVGGVTGALAQFKQSANDLFENFSQGVSQIFGPAVETVIRLATRATNALGNFFKSKFGDGTLESQIDVVSKKLETLQSNLTAKGDKINVFDIVELRDLSLELTNLINKRNQLEQLETSSKITQKINEQTEALKKREEQISAQIPKLAALDQAILQGQIQAIQQRIQVETDADRAITLNKELAALENKRILEESKKLELEAIRLFNEGVISSEEELGNRLQQIRNNTAANLKTANDEVAASQANTLNNVQQFGSTFGAFINNAVKTLQNAAQLIKVGFFQSVGKELENLGTNLAKGQSLFENFGKATLGIVGDILITLGNAAIAAATVGSAIPILGPITGGPAGFAIGAGLIIAGGALKAIAGAAASNITQPTVSSTGIIGQQTIVEPSLNISDQISRLDDTARRPNEAGTQITVNIEGLISDTDETGIRIVQIINNAFDRQGLTIRQGAVV